MFYLQGEWVQLLLTHLLLKYFFTGLLLSWPVLYCYYYYICSCTIILRLFVQARMAQKRTNKIILTFIQEEIL